jgi:hypothetical protein
MLLIRSVTGVASVYHGNVAQHAKIENVAGSISESLLKGFSDTCITYLDTNVGTAEEYTRLSSGGKVPIPIKCCYRDICWYTWRT